MQALAIDDHVTTKLYAWYTIVSEWEPPGAGFEGVCAECADSALACSVDITAWPHDVIHSLVASLRSAIADVQDSYREECEWDAASAPEVARRAVADTLARYAADIQDVLDKCLTDRLQAYVTGQVELGEWELRRPAAS
jgi:hypothetical protein